MSSVLWLSPAGIDDPYDPPPVDTGVVGASLVMPYGVWGRTPQRTETDVVRSVKKHLAEVLDALAGGFLVAHGPTGDETASESWEVRLGDEEGTFRFPFAMVAATGTSLPTMLHPNLMLLTMPMTIHLYPGPAQDSENAVLVAEQLRGIISRALSFGAARGRPLLIPLWDWSASPGLYDDTETRYANDFVQIESLSLGRMVDPEDDRHPWVVANFRAQWRQVPSPESGTVVESLRVTAHPS